MDEDPHRFPKTRWTLVEAAGDETVSGPRPALSELLNWYLPVLRAHLVSHKRLEPELADDLLQGFVAKKILEKELIDQADRARGKFRTFLLTALDNYVRNEHRDRQAQRRGGGKVASLDAGRLGEPHDSAPAPDQAFDLAWARAVINQAVRRMESQCKASGRMDLWALFDARVLQPAFTGRAGPDYADLVARFGFEDPAQASNSLITAKRMFARMLRAVVGDYIQAPGDTDAEIRDLQRVLSNAGA